MTDDENDDDTTTIAITMSPSTFPVILLSCTVLIWVIFVLVVLEVVCYSFDCTCHVNK